MTFPHPWKQALAALALNAALYVAQAQDAPPPDGGGAPPPDVPAMAAQPEGEAPPAPEAPVQENANNASANNTGGSAAPAATTTEEASAAHVYQNDSGAAVQTTTQDSTNGTHQGRRSRRNGNAQTTQTNGEPPAPATSQGEGAPTAEPAAPPTVEVIPAVAAALPQTSSVSLADQGPEDTLISTSPFLSPLYAMRRTTTGLNGLRPANSVEFRGAVCLGGQWQFSLYDPREKRGFWVRMDDENSPYRVTAFNQEGNSISLNVNGMVSEVPLNRPVDTPLAIASTGGGARASTGATATAGNGQNTTRHANAQANNAQGNQRTAQGGNAQNTSRQANNANASGNGSKKQNAPANGVYVGGQTDSAGTQTSAPVTAQAAAQTQTNTATGRSSTQSSGTSNTRRRIALPNQ